MLLWDNWGEEGGREEGHWHAHTRGLWWGLPEVVGMVQQMLCSRRRLLQRGLEFHVCTINKSAHTKKSGNLFNDPRISPESVLPGLSTISAFLFLICQVTQSTYWQKASKWQMKDQHVTKEYYKWKIKQKFKLILRAKVLLTLDLNSPKLLLGENVYRRIQSSVQMFSASLFAFPLLFSFSFFFLPFSSLSTVLYYTVTRYPTGRREIKLLLLVFELTVSSRQKSDR